MFSSNFIVKLFTLPHLIGVNYNGYIYRFNQERIERISISNKSWEIYDSQETLLKLQNTTILRCLIYNKEILFYLGSYCPEIFSYQIEQKKWNVIKFQKLDDFPDILYAACSVSVYQDSIYVYGGIGDTSNDLCQYDLQTKTMKLLEFNGNPPEARAGHSSWVHKDKLYIFGGMNKYNVYLNDLYVFDFLEFNWKEIQTLGRWPYARAFSSFIIDEDVLYLFGGCRGRFDPENDLWEYDFTSQQWRRLFVPPEAKRRFSNQLLIKGNKLMTVGGVGIDKKEVLEIDIISINQIHPQLLNCLKNENFNDCLIITNENKEKPKSLDDVVQNIHQNLSNFLESISKLDDEQKIIEIAEFLENSFVFQHWRHTFSKI